MTCDLCDATCLNCIDGSNTGCLSCPIRKLYLYGSRCIVNCPDGFYNDILTSVCTLCDPTCKTCVGGGVYKCKTCRNNNYLNKLKSCIEDCGE